MKVPQFYFLLALAANTLLKGASSIDAVRLTSKYCKVYAKECVSSDLKEPTYVPKDSQCQYQCNHLSDCHLAFVGTDRMCHLRNKRCYPDEYVTASGSSYIRLAIGESCPQGSRPFNVPNIYEQKSYCMITNKACPGHNLYIRPWILTPYTKCLDKCDRLKECGMADFNAKAMRQCEVMSHVCELDQLVDMPGNMNYIRLRIGQTDCPPGYQPAREPILTKPAEVANIHTIELDDVPLTGVPKDTSVDKSLDNPLAFAMDTENENDWIKWKNCNQKGFKYCYQKRQCTFDVPGTKVMVADLKLCMEECNRDCNCLSVQWRKGNNCLLRTFVCGATAESLVNLNDDGFYDYNKIPEDGECSSENDHKN